jgi:hypothetical protein
MNERGEGLWYSAVLLTSMLTIALWFYDSFWLALVFWLVAMLILMALRPQ